MIIICKPQNHWLKNILHIICIENQECFKNDLDKSWTLLHFWLTDGLQQLLPNVMNCFSLLFSLLSKGMTKISTHCSTWVMRMWIFGVMDIPNWLWSWRIQLRRWWSFSLQSLSNIPWVNTALATSLKALKVTKNSLLLDPPSIYGSSISRFLNNLFRLGPS